MNSFPLHKNPKVHVLSSSDYISKNVRLHTHQGTEYALYVDCPVYFDRGQHICDIAINDGLEMADPNGRVEIHIPRDRVLFKVREGYGCLYVTCEPKEMYLKNRFKGFNMIDKTADTDMPFVAYYEGETLCIDNYAHYINSCKKMIMHGGVTETEFHVMGIRTYSTSHENQTSKSHPS